MHQEGPHMQMPRQPNNRMFRTMSVPHMAMGPGQQQQQPMYGDYNGQVVEYAVLHWVLAAVAFSQSRMLLSSLNAKVGLKSKQSSSFSDCRLQELEQCCLHSTCPA